MKWVDKLSGVVEGNLKGRNLRRGVVLSINFWDYHLDGTCNPSRHRSIMIKLSNDREKVEYLQITGPWLDVSWVDDVLSMTEEEKFILCMEKGGELIIKTIADLHTGMNITIG